MKTHASLIASFIIGAGALSLQAASAAQPAATTPAFELPRLKTHRKAGGGDAPGMARRQATIAELSPGKSKAREAAEGKIKYLVLDGNDGWSSPVRGEPDDTTFVSFFVYGSEGTSMDIAGAKLLVRAAAGKPGYAKLAVAAKAAKPVAWREVGGPVKIETFGGAPLAALPVLTVRLAPKSGMWDLYSGGRLVAADLPLATLPKDAFRQFTLHAGVHGARVCGLVSTDENPLCEDANSNGIDDSFEKQNNGGALLAADSPATTRTQLARLWQQDQKNRPVASLAVQRPLPDGVAAKGKGK